MECACTVEVDFSDGDEMELLSVKQLHAARKHKCDECKEDINRGDWCHREVFKCAGNIETHRTCEHCYSLRQVFFSRGWYYGIIWDQMQEFIGECDGDISVECIRMLTPKARGKVLDMVEERWEQLISDEEEQ